MKKAACTAFNAHTVPYNICVGYRVRPVALWIDEIFATKKEADLP